MDKVMVISVDGGEPSLVFDWIKKNKLPTFSKLMKQGSSGTLQSTIPCGSAMAWTSFMTGVNPGEHGIFTNLKKNNSVVQFQNGFTLGGVQLPSATTDLTFNNNPLIQLFGETFFNISISCLDCKEEHLIGIENDITSTYGLSEFDERNLKKKNSFLKKIIELF